MAADTQVPFSIFKNHEVNHHTSFSFSSDHSSLAATGHLIDTITSHTAVPRGSTIGYDVPSLPTICNENASPSPLHYAPPRLPEPYSSILFRTLIFDRDDSGCLVDRSRWHWIFYQLLGEAALYHHRPTTSPARPQSSIQSFFLLLYRLYKDFKLQEDLTVDEVVRKEFMATYQADVPDVSLSEATEARNTVMNAVVGRRLALTGEGHVGLVPACTVVGDAVVVLHGCPVPVVMRKLEEKWEIVGTCYVHGIMEGEVVQGSKEGRYVEEVFMIQ